MIISHRHKFIFIKTRKTAGTSIEILLSSICGEHDIITPISPKDEELRKQFGFRGAQNFAVDKKYHSRFEWYSQGLLSERKHFKNHLTGQQVRQWIDKDVWNNYYKFSLERNPFDKVMSLYHYAGGDEKFRSLTNFIDLGMMRGCMDFDHYTYGGMPILDKVYRYENLKEAVSEIEEKLQLRFTKDISELKTKSGFRTKKLPYQEVISDHDRSKIELAFAREIKFFNYQF